MFYAKVALQRPNVRALDAFSLDVEIAFDRPQIYALYGPSGSGKSTLLRVLTGFEPSAHAKIILKNRLYQEGDKHSPPQQRPFGYLSQHEDLLPHLTLNQNLAFAEQCAARSSRTSEQPTRYTPPLDRSELLNLLKLQPLSHHYPDQLSQGEKQRTRIARALLQQPQLLLLDEPFVNIDHDSKEMIFGYLKKVVERWSVPIIFVSHIFSEILALSDYLFIMDRGGITIHGETATVLSDLNNPINSTHLASSLLDVTHIQYDTTHQLVEAALEDQTLLFHASPEHIQTTYRIAIYAHAISLSLEKPHACSILNTLKATVIDIEQDTLDALIKLKIGRQYLISRITLRSLETLNLTVGQTVFALIKSVAITPPAF